MCTAIVGLNVEIFHLNTDVLRWPVLFQVSVHCLGYQYSVLIFLVNERVLSSFKAINTVTSRTNKCTPATQKHWSGFANCRSAEASRPFTFDLTLMLSSQISATSKAKVKKYWSWERRSSLARRTCSVFNHVPKGVKNSKSRTLRLRFRAWQPPDLR